MHNVRHREWNQTRATKKAKQNQHRKKKAIEINKNTKHKTKNIKAKKQGHDENKNKDHQTEQNTKKNTKKKQVERIESMPCDDQTNKHTKTQQNRHIIADTNNTDSKRIKTKANQQHERQNIMVLNRER